MSLVDKPGFKDTDVGWFANEWLLTTLGGACSGRLQTGPFGSQLHADEYQDYGVPVLMPKDLIGFRADLTSAARISPERADELARHKLKSGDLLFSRRGDVARFALIDSRSEGALCGTGCLRATPSENHIPLFLAHFLQLDAIKDWLEKNAVGQTMPNMNTSILAALPLVLPPSKAEQQRIAAILTAVDDKLNVVARQIEATQSLKQGLMQTLFSRGTRSQAAADWPTVELHTVAEVRTGVAKGKKGLKGPVELPYLRVANVQAGHIDLSEVKTIEVEASQVERYALQAGDVLMTEGGDFDKLGRGDVWLGQIEPCLHQNHVFAVRPDPAQLNPHYLAEFASSEQGRKYFLGCAKRTTNLASINSSQLKAFPIPLPPLETQVEIATVAASVNAKIELLEAKRREQEKLKRGLMQKLLTGEWRVKVDAEMAA